MKTPNLHETPRELFKFKFFESLLYSIVLFFAEKTKIWKRPIRAHGDLENMGFKDIAYWLYKTTNPIRYARAGSDLENYFAKQNPNMFKLPPNFQQINEITLSAVGDLINHSYLKNTHDLYSEIGGLIFGADISMANLECTVHEKTRKFEFNTTQGPPLHYSTKEFQIIKGFNDQQYTFLSTACNHSLDFGEEGVNKTIQALEKENILYNGLNKKETDSSKVTIVEKKNIKIGIFSYTFGLNAYQTPSNRPKIVNYTNLNDDLDKINLTQIKQQLNYCKENNVDLIIAQLHWGMEHEFYPTPEQVKLAHHLAELGVDVIIGHHSHVVQPVEYYQTQRDPNRIVPVYYSLGNLVNSFSAEYLCLSYIAQLHLVQGLIDNTKQTYIKNVNLHHVRQSIDHTTNKVRLSLEK